eukprot:gene17486-20117_t
MDLLSSDSEEEKKLQKKAKKKTSSDVDSNALRVNQKFASEFERRERYKELQRAKEISLDDDVEPDSESDESQDEEAVLLSPGLDVKILQTINMLKKKDPKIYDPNAKWFSDPSEDEDDSDDDSDDDGAKAEKKLRYKDVLRQQLIADGAGDSDADSSAKNKRDMESTKKSQLLYDREQEELRKQFLKAAKNVDGSDADDDANDSDDDLLQVKHKSAAERAEEERAYQQALEEMKALEKEKEAEESTFLHEFLSKKMWKDPMATRSNAMDTDDDNNDVSDEEDEEADIGTPIASLLFDFLTDPRSSIYARIWSVLTIVLVICRILELSLESCPGPNQYDGRPKDLSEFYFLLTKQQYWNLYIALMVPLIIDGLARLLFLLLILWESESHPIYEKFRGDLMEVMLFFTD